MSVVTTQPEMLTSVPSTSNGWLPAGGSHDYPRDGAGVDGDRRVERRRNGSPGDSPMDILTRLPAVVVLERIAGSFARYGAGRHHLVREYGVCRDGGLPAGQA